MSGAFARPLPFGATVLDDDRVRFRLWAPAQTAVSVILDDDRAVPMRRAGDWFEATVSGGAGTHYRYRLGDGTLVPDPASRFQPDDVHGPSQVVDPAAYAWRHADWMGRPWREAVIYELHAGCLGGFRGVMAELPRLAQLGITAVELMPIADFPGRHNWGYDGVLPFAPDSAYGTPAELKALVDAAHEHGLMMFLDVVYNHFGPDGNYLRLYAPQMFRSDVHTPWGAAIDFRRPEVRRFFTENALHWLTEYRFDGLRLDAVHEIGEPAWLDEMADEVRRSVEPNRYVHLILENEHNQASHLMRDIDAQWNDDGHHAFHVLLTGEDRGYYRDYAEAGAAGLAKVLAEGFFFQGQNSSHRGRPRGTPSRDLPTTAFVLFLQNHDQVGNRAFGERLTALADPAALEAAIAAQMLCPQIPMLFMGEENASQTPFLFFTDHPPELAAIVRDGRRQEFAHFPEFADPGKRDAIPDPNAAATFAASVSLPDPAHAEARRGLYRRLIAIRKREIVPELERTRSIAAQPLGSAAVSAQWRLGNAGVLTVAVNLGPVPVPLQPPAGRLLFGMPDAAGGRAEAGELPPRATVAFLDPHQ
ncbi:MAG TPA: malto-oligosyltrehalose trehalohydrolase [Acetobacteraceae bacterium]|nr:malto-oligosyltrehalose trehalohydrolase [Acetobacteraceae bacterium]